MKDEPNFQLIFRRFFWIYFNLLKTTEIDDLSYEQGIWTSNLAHYIEK